MDRERGGGGERMKIYRYIKIYKIYKEWGKEWRYIYRKNA